VGLNPDDYSLADVTSHTQGQAYSHAMARRGSSNITVRMDPDLWRRFGDVAEDRSELIRAFVAWYAREPGAKMPRRPEVNRTATPDE
jgi:hypothetical protein